jgi:hypothetical protein
MASNLAVLLKAGLKAAENSNVVSALDSQDGGEEGSDEGVEAREPGETAVKLQQGTGCIQHIVTGKERTRDTIQTQNVHD